MKRRITRLVTLLCFFHFSGLNNGYSYSMVASVNVTQSVSLVSLVTGGCYSRINSSGLAFALDQSRKFILSLALRVRPAAEINLAASSRKILSMPFKSPALFKAGAGAGRQAADLDVSRDLLEAVNTVLLDGRERVISERQSNYVRENKENWTKSRGRKTNSPLLVFSSPWKARIALASLNMTGAVRWFDRSYEIIKRNVRLMLGGQDRSEEDSLLLLVRTQIPDPSLNRTGFLTPRQFNDNSRRRSI